jgi:hypothetical protein
MIYLREIAERRLIEAALFSSTADPKRGGKQYP